MKENRFLFRISRAAGKTKYEDVAFVVQVEVLLALETVYILRMLVLAMTHEFVTSRPAQ